MKYEGQNLIYQHQTNQNEFSSYKKNEASSYQKPQYHNNMIYDTKHEILNSYDQIQDFELQSYDQIQDFQHQSQNQIIDNNINLYTQSSSDSHPQMNLGDVMENFSV